MADEDVPCYIGIAPCGHACYAQVDDPAKKNDKNYQRDIAKSIAKLIRRGWTIEKKTVGWVRSGGLTFCDCEKKARAEKRLAKKASTIS